MHPLKGLTPARRWACSAERETLLSHVCGRERREGKKERKRLFHNQKEQRQFRATLSLNSRLMQNKKKKSIIKYTAGEAAVTAEHLASATVCNNILSFHCSIVTTSQHYCFLYSPPFLLGLIPCLLHFHTEWKEKKVNTLFPNYRWAILLIHHCWNETFNMQQSAFLSQENGERISRVHPSFRT